MESSAANTWQHRNLTSTALPQRDGVTVVTGGPSLLTVIAVDTLITLVCGCAVTAAVLWRLNRRSQRKEERDKLGHIITTQFWSQENQIAEALSVLSKMKQRILFRDVSQLHILGYKYRQESGAYESREGFVQNSHFNDPQSSDINFNLITTLKNIERLFDSVALQLPCKGKCGRNVASAVSVTFYNLAQATSLLWCDYKARLIYNLVHYFAGKVGADRFSAALVSDEDLETVVLARVPYVSQLCLNSDHFVLLEVEISNDLKIDLRNKIRYVDTVLSKNDKSLLAKDRNIIDSYNQALELCLKNEFVPHKNHLSDFLTKDKDANKVKEYVIHLLHLLRVMCVTRNMKKLESDEKFFQFLMHLYEALYTWTETGAMLEVIERSRNNIVAYVRGLTPEQMLLDKEHTKAKLEQIEKELYRHLNRLTMKHVQLEKDRCQYFRKCENDPKLRTVDSDTSIYTMAMSASSFMMQRHAHDQERGRVRSLEHLHKPYGLDKQYSLDQSSILSGSSIYATAASVSSGENIPLMRQSPPSPRSLTPLPHQSPNQSKSGSEEQVLDESGDPNDFFETAV